MPLPPGTRLGPYEVVAPLGAGGMGEVYKATDTRLNRAVAIKVLPPSLAQQADRLSRFEREAKVLAALNHPHIATIYGLEETGGGTSAIVMELVGGPTLAERLSAGPLQADEAVVIARQIAAALEAAHERGVVHRDLKPANIKAPPDGPVKVLDFGLATALQESAQGVDVGRSQSPTLTIGATQAGVILGTAGYMSPEQAAGKPVDKRSDIWSFGVVLWEMITGTPLFAGETTSHILADVLRAPIDFARVPAVPLRELLQRCLDRDVTTRLRDIGEARIALARPLRPVAAESAPLAAGPAVMRSVRVAWAAAAILAVSTAIAVWAPWEVEPDRPLVRLDVDLGPDVALVTNAAQSTVVLSPDGSRLVYVTEPRELWAVGAQVRAARPPGGDLRQGGRGRASGIPARHLFVRRLDQPEAIELTDATNALNPFFSPDGQWIAFAVFRAGGRGGSVLHKISVDGGAAVPLAEITDFGGGDWADDGTIVIGGSSGLWRIPPGGQPVQLTKPRDGERAHLGPRILPGGRTALFASISGEPDSTTAVIEAASLADGTRKELVRGGISPHYLPTGHLAYMSNGALFAIAFDPEALETRGTAVPILDDVQFAAGIGAANLSFSRGGTLVYRKGEGVGGIGPARLATIDWVDASGKRSPLLSQPERFSRLRFSPDGRLLAVLIADAGDRDYWVYDLQRGTRNKITFGGLSVSTVAWTPDSRHLLVGSGAGGRANSIGIYWTSADGASQPQRILERQGGVLFPTSFSGAAKRLLYGPIGGDVLMLPLAQEQGQWKAGAPEAFIETEFSEVAPAFSPDGRWIAYATNETGQFEVNVRAFPPPASGQPRQWTVSPNGGTRPLWSSDGRELLYQEGDRIMAVRYTVSGDEFKPETPRVRIEKLGANEENWDLAPDGRIAAVTPVETADTAEPAFDRTVVFLQNFFDEVKRRVP